MPGTCLRRIKYFGRAIVDHPRAACHAKPNKVLFHSYDVSKILTGLTSKREVQCLADPAPLSVYMKFGNC
jgi:hypothetical protein